MTLPTDRFVVSCQLKASMGALMTNTGVAYSSTLKKKNLSSLGDDIIFLKNKKGKANASTVSEMQ